MNPKLKEEIKRGKHIAIHNQAQRDMTKRFGWFTMMFLFWLPKYDKWYDKRVRELKNQLKEIK